MKYYKGDIVEIITSKYKSYQDIPRHEVGYFESTREPAPYIGQRFRVEFIMTGKAYGKFDSKTYKGASCLGTDFSHIRLYRRPLKNWIKFIWDKITGK